MQISKKSSKENILLVGFPSNGLVGTFTISYLVHHLKMKQIGEIEHPDLPPTLFVEDGEILPPIRIYKKNNLFVILYYLIFLLIHLWHMILLNQYWITPKKIKSKK
jgi:uncharacterized protein